MVLQIALTQKSLYPFDERGAVRGEDLAGKGVRDAISGFQHGRQAPRFQ